MNPFAKLSALQWEILSDLVYHADRDGRPDKVTSTRRAFWYPESWRVSKLRALSNLARRGLLARERESVIVWYRLAVSPRAVVNAMDDIEPRSVTDIRREILRRCVDRIERREAREARRQARARSPKPDPDATPSPRQLDGVAAALKIFAEEGATDLESRVVATCQTWWSPELIRRCLDDLRASGQYDEIIREATGSAEGRE
jgi:hypothetical protein